MKSEGLNNNSKKKRALDSYEYPLRQITQMLFRSLNDRTTCLVTAGLLSATPECVRANLNILLSLLSLKFKLKPEKGS